LERRKISCVNEIVGGSEEETVAFEVESGEEENFLLRL
jgi:hypothetical protein